ncbi:MAG TPA: hypothetical protein PKE31_04025 [Pseudomonadota bacterium]|nr:hypothetical protein [Pseudomonadota bacterium]
MLAFLFGCAMCVLVPTVEVGTDVAKEVVAETPSGLLESGMRGEIRRFYSAGIREIRQGHIRDALSELRQARVLAYREYLRGPTLGPWPRRHFVRISYVEGQVHQLQLINDHLSLRSDRGSDYATSVQLRALILHNIFLAVRSFTGKAETNLAKGVFEAYSEAILLQGRLSRDVSLGYSAMLAEEGQYENARREFGKISPADLAAEGADVAVIYTHLAMGETSLAVRRFLETTRRDNWQRAAKDETSLRTSMYRMNDFDRLRSHPRFVEMVTMPEEEADR